jgi:prepilin-type N-terminal cleavage/methylation domain-containing protein
MQKLRTKTGFSLTEVMVAMMILSVGMLGVGSMLTYSLRSDETTTRIRNAEFICIKKIEEIKGMKPTGGWVGYTGGNEDVDYRWDPANPAVLTSYPSIYVRQWTVAPFLLDGATADPHMKLLTMTVGWPVSTDCTKLDPSKCPHRYTMTTYFRGLE